MKKKAFTLTELLVVVVIIGVLSAVVLPKFTKVLETRKTTEAESMLMAVRGEQEARCTLDRPYVQEANKTQLASLPSNTGSNYTYTLTGSGITATSQDKEYALKIESYQDGSICCSGTYCDSLNKKYPKCTGVSTDTTGCGVADVNAEVNPEPGPEPEPEPTPEPAKTCSGESSRQCGCKNGGTQTRTCNTTTGEWSEWGACSIAQECSCGGTKPEESADCNECGTKTRTVTCNTTTGEWDEGEWSTCSKTEEECDCVDPQPEDEGERCTPEGYAADCGVEKTFYKCENHEWKVDSERQTGCMPTACTCGDMTDGFCEENGLVTNEKVFDKAPGAQSSVQELLSTCCLQCPSDWCIDKDGRCTEECSAKFETKESSTIGTAVAGQDGVYANFQRTVRPDLADWVCKYEFTGTSMEACWNSSADNLTRSRIRSHFCDSCDPNAETCSNACYFPESYSQVTSQWSSHFYWNHSSSAGCQVIIDENVPKGYTVEGYIGSDVTLCHVNGYGASTDIKASDIVSKRCDGCGGAGVQQNLSGSVGWINGGGGVSVGLCFYPQTANVSGLYCSK